MIATVSSDESSESVIVAPERANDRLEFAKSVAMGLTDTPPWLHSRYLYDDEGSRLFEEICRTPEYYLTDSEAQILRRHAGDIRDVTGPVTLIELGSGNSAKTDYLLGAYAECDTSVRYVPIDVSDSILRQAKDAIVARHPNVTVTGIADTYERAFPLFAPLSPAMVLFLGSSIGNFDQREADAFWTELAAALASGDYLLLGVDLVKDETLLHAAYNDAAGVTASFTRNLFARINTDLGAEIDLDAVDHVARYNREWQRIEIFARFNQDQPVYLEPIDRTIDVAAGTMVMTEISRKFSLPKITEFLRCFDLAVETVFTDDNDWFAVLLARKV